MPKAPQKTRHQTTFHRAQIGRAQRYIRQHVDRDLTLGAIAREAGASSYHFARLFHAYTGETPFEFLRRLRLIEALRRLQKDPDGAITDIALDVGYETPWAFNKVFKKTLQMSPRDFHNIGKDRQYDVIRTLSKPRLTEEGKVNLSKHEVITRPVTHYVFVEKHGPFAEVAPPAWNEMFPLVFSQFKETQLKEFLGLSGIDKSKFGEETMIYQAGVAVTEEPEVPLKGLQYRKIKSGKYARFILKGPYTQIWMAFEKVFRILAEEGVELRKEFCIENYVNDPKTTPEDQLLTEILIPCN